MYLEPCNIPKTNMRSNQQRREGGSRGKFPGPGSQEGPGKSLTQTGSCIYFSGAEAPSCPCTAAPVQGPVLFTAPGRELALDGLGCNHWGSSLVVSGID